MAMMAMALFLFVWCWKLSAAFYRNRWALDGRNRTAFEQQSHARGLTLLKHWLSPVQLRSYERHGHFDVIGSASGQTFRIHYGREANVEQLDNFGQPVCAWCFVPEGDLVIGDVMLAQKIALETDEDAALAVAIQYTTLRRRLITRAGPLSLAS